MPGEHARARKGAIDVAASIEGARPVPAGSPAAPAERPSELAIAQTIQEALLPGHRLAFEGYDMAGFSQAASHAGGDHYDWRTLPDGRMLMTLADVSGHGIGPAIVTAVCRAYARAVLAEPEPLPALIQRLNRLVSADLPGGRFITFIAGALDPHTHELSVVSAGHGPYFVVRQRDGIVERHGAHGLPLGVDEHAVYDSQLAVRLAPGDSLVLISDGFVEGRSGDGELFGAMRFERVLAERAACAPAMMIDAARGALSAFGNNAAPLDDMTMVVLRRGAR